MGTIDWMDVVNSEQRSGDGCQIESHVDWRPLSLEEFTTWASAMQVSYMQGKTIVVLTLHWKGGMWARVSAVIQFSASVMGLP